MELLYGTTNEGKILAMKRTLKPLGISLKGLKDLECEIPHVKETGNSPLENARQKARAYYQAFHIPVFSCDTGLYFENIPEEFQPGIYVRRPLGYEMSDEQMTEYYRGLVICGLSIEMPSVIIGQNRRCMRVIPPNYLGRRFYSLRSHIQRANQGFRLTGFRFRSPVGHIIMICRRMLRMRWRWMRGFRSFFGIVWCVSLFHLHVNANINVT